MIIIDTNVLSEPLRSAPDKRVLAWLDAQPSENLFLTSISLAEMMFGAAVLPDGNRKMGLLEAIDEIANDLFAGRCLPFDQAAALAYGTIAAAMRRSGMAISMPDGQIAAIATVHGFVVATRDRAPFQACGIKVIDPWA